MNNYRVDVFSNGNHSMVEFPEYWLAKLFADSAAQDDRIESVYMLERISDRSFDITKRIK